MAGTLYLVGTPIGNLGDMTPRAVEVLSQVDFIAAEDTRVTGKLLSHFGIAKPQLSYFAHSSGLRARQIVDRVAAGNTAPLSPTQGCPASLTLEKNWWLSAPRRGFPFRWCRALRRQSPLWHCPGYPLPGSPLKDF